MSDLSWLKRSFDPRLRYVLGLPFWFLIMLVFFEVVPIPELPEGWRNPAQMVLLLTLCFVCLCVYVIKKDQKHSFIRGIGWNAAGGIAGCQVSAAVLREMFPLWTAGILALCSAYHFLTEWRERDLKEE